MFSSWLILLIFRLFKTEFFLLLFLKPAHPWEPFWIKISRRLSGHWLKLVWTTCCYTEIGPFWLWIRRLTFPQVVCFEWWDSVDRLALRFLVLRVARPLLLFFLFALTLFGLDSDQFLKGFLLLLNWDRSRQLFLLPWTTFIAWFGTWSHRWGILAMEQLLNYELVSDRVGLIYNSTSRCISFELKLLAHNRLFFFHRIVSALIYCHHDIGVKVFLSGAGMSTWRKSRYHL